MERQQGEEQLQLQPLTSPSPSTKTEDGKCQDRAMERQQEQEQEQEQLQPLTSTTPKTRAGGGNYQDLGGARSGRTCCFTLTIIIYPLALAALIMAFFAARGLFNRWGEEQAHLIPGGHHAHATSTPRQHIDILPDMILVSSARKRMHLYTHARAFVYIL